jgi:hypothetical protein
MRQISFVVKFVFAAVCCCSFAYGQDSNHVQYAKTDSSSQQSALNNALNYFYASLGKQSPLYNGTEYYFYDPIIKGSAYFLDVKAFTPGSVYYNGALYKNVPMLYDTYSDKVVVLLYNHFSKFSLVNEKVKSFDFLEHHFININADTLNNNSVIRSGFYDEVYGGKTQVLVRWTKDIQISTGGVLGPESYFNPTKHYYIRKANVYYTVTGKGSLIDILRDKKKEVQQYIKANKIKFRQDPEEAMVKIASYYDHLIN